MTKRKGKKWTKYMYIVGRYKCIFFARAFFEKDEHFTTFSGMFRSECKYILLLPTISVHCCYRAMSNDTNEQIQVQFKSFQRVSPNTSALILLYVSYRYLCIYRVQETIY